MAAVDVLTFVKFRNEKYIFLYLDVYKYLTTSMLDTNMCLKRCILLENKSYCV